MYRRVTHQDVPRLLKLEIEAFGPDSSLHDVENCCTEQTGLVHVVDDDIVGYILYKNNISLQTLGLPTHINTDMSFLDDINSSDKSIIDVMYIVSVYVIPAHQGKGIAKTLFDALPKGYPTALHVKKSNHHAIKLYTKLGFVPILEVNSFFKGEIGQLYFNPSFGLFF